MVTENDEIISYAEVTQRWERYLSSLTQPELDRLESNNHDLYERYRNYTNISHGRPDTDHSYEAVASTHSIPEDPVELGRLIEKALSSQRI